MPSKAFVIAKLIGREFEQAMIPVLEERGFRVIDVDGWKYSQKKGRDVIVEIQGHRSSIEFKYDRMSEKTGNVVVDLDSLNKTDSAIWIYGLPEGKVIHTYSMKTTELGPYALNWSVKRPAGEFGGLVALIPKRTFLGQKFVYKLKTINLN